MSKAATAHTAALQGEEQVGMEPRSGDTAVGTLEIAEPKQAGETSVRPERQKARKRALRTAVTLIIPVRNEEAGIEATLDEARRVLDEAAIEAEILVVDDGSTDGSVEIARRNGARVVKHLYNRGYGYALRSGILAAEHETIIICDADGTYPLNRIPDLITRYEEGYDLVIGARRGKHFNGSLIKGAARWFFHRLCESATGQRIPDANSGLRIFRKQAIMPYLPMMCTGFSFTTSQTLCFMSLGRPVCFLPIDYRARIGSTKVRHVADAVRTAQYIFQMFVIFNPVKLFTLLAFWPLLGAAGVLAFQAISAWRGAFVSWGLTAVLAAMGVSVAALLFGMGLMIFGISRQRWPDTVSGKRNSP